MPISFVVAFRDIVNSGCISFLEITIMKLYYYTFMITVVY